MFVRSLREGNFDMYNILILWFNWLLCFFALDHTHYSRWLPDHIKDMKERKSRNAEINKNFNEGNFAVHRTSKVFSAIGIDQAHEQNNTLVKGDGGVIGLTQDDASLQRWMVAGPEITRMVHEFENCKEDAPSTHHDQSESDLGKPFSEHDEELVSLSSKHLAIIQPLPMPGCVQEI